MDKSTVLLLSKLQTESGNYGTALRLKSYIETAGFICLLKDPKLLHVNDFPEFVQDHNVETIFALHAYHSGKILTDLPPNFCYVVILGGTDINELCHDSEKMKTMTKVIKNARFIVGFSKTMIDTAKRLWDFINPNCFLEIPQAVATVPSDFSLSSYLETNCHLLSPADSLDVFLLVSGIRPVKDPLFLVEAFADWHCNHPTSLFVILGPCLDEAYCQEFLKKIKNLDGVVYIPGLKATDTQACIKTSFALVNSSLSEGMSATILEAMQLCVPVIARDVQGNSNLIKDNRTGLLYKTPQEFIRKAEMLLGDKHFRSDLISRAQADVFAHHNVKQEEQAYIQLLNTLHYRPPSSLITMDAEKRKE